MQAAQWAQQMCRLHPTAHCRLLKQSLLSTVHRLATGLRVPGQERQAAARGLLAA